MCTGDRLAQLIQHALQMRDELLFKVLRNISQQDDVGVKERFVPYIDALVGLLKVGRHAAVAAMPAPCQLRVAACCQTALACSRCASRLAHSLLLCGSSPPADSCPQKPDSAAMSTLHKCPVPQT